MTFDIATFVPEPCRGPACRREQIDASEASSGRFAAGYPGVVVYQVEETAPHHARRVAALRRLYLEHYGWDPDRYGWEP